MFFSRLKQRISDQYRLLKWLYVNAHNKDLVLFTADERWNSVKNSFFQNGRFVIHSEQLNCLKQGLDQRSCNTIELFVQRTLQAAPFFNRDVGLEMMLKVSSIKNWFTDEEKRLWAEWLAVEKDTLRKYQLDRMDISVGYMHHGLRFASENIKNYIQSKTFIDAGAYIGDSSLVLLEYQPLDIIAFEISEKNAESYLETMQKNSVDESKYTLVQKGLGAEPHKIFYADTGEENTNLLVHGCSEVEIMPLDAYLDGKNKQIGFIKADVEGAGLDMVKGMTETLKKDRPVLALAAYHSPDEFLKIKPFIKDLQLNYQFEFQNHYSEYGYGDFVLFAYPRELVHADCE